MMAQDNKRIYFEIAEHFLQEHPKIWADHRTAVLAMLLQGCVEGYIKSELDRAQDEKQARPC